MATKENERVKTYRVLRDGVRHGDSVRNFGDFLPEARTLPTFAVLKRADVIEEIWVDKEEFEEWEERQAKADALRLRGVDPEVVEEVEDELAASPPVVKKKKAVVKKTTAKKTVKKGTTNVGKLEERPV